MAEGIFKDSFQALRELENKVGRKTPESLLVWTRDAADCDGGVRSVDVVDSSEQPSALSDDISAEINYIKGQMQWLRSADVRILRQLVTVHEGIEAMRWLMEDRGALASQSCSLAGSLSSLVTVEEHGPWNSACSESPTWPRDLTETTEEELAGRRPPHSYNGGSDFKSHSNVMRHESTGARPPGPSNFNIEEAICSTHGKPARVLTIASLQKSQPLDLHTGPVQACRSGANTIKRALVRSSGVRKEMNVDTSYKESGKIQPEKVSHSSKVEDDQKLFLGYDAQWCWVNSQDDVTFL